MRATMKRPSNKGTFKKGKAPKHPKAGRPKGKPNRTTAILKDAILMAAEQVGENGKGLDGLVGYLRMLAVKERVVYARLLERVMPFQLAVNPSGPQKYTPQEAVEKLRERGMPVPAPLLSLAGGMLHLRRPRSALAWPAVTLVGPKRTLVRFGATSRLRVRINR